MSLDPRILMRRRWSDPTWGRGAGRWLARLILVVLSAVPGWAEVAPAVPGVITDVNQVWSLSAAERERAYPLQVEGVVTYVDPIWHNLWFEVGGQGFYATLGDDLVELQPGRRVRIEGTLVPKLGLQRARTHVTVLAENVPSAPLDARGRIGELALLDRRLVLAEGYVDTQQLIDDRHLRLVMITENRPVVVWVVPDDPQHLPNWPGAFVQLTGVYSGRIDPSGNDSTIEIWVARAAALTVQHRVADEPRFQLPVTPVNAARNRTAGDWIHLQGVVERRLVGEGIMLRGDGGDMLVRSIQRAVIPRGATVEAVGRLKSEGSRWVLDEALIRPASPAARAAVAAAAADAPGRVEQVRALSFAEAAEGRAVELEGTVIWADPSESFFYLADSTGGVRVAFDPQTFVAPAFNKYLHLQGRTRAAETGPEVTLTGLIDLGTRSHPEPRVITVAQALSGGVEAQWVELRGFLQEIVSAGDWRKIKVTTPTGEFVAQLNSPVNFVANPGSLLSLHGVCETVRDSADGDLAVRLRVPFLHDITVVEEAPRELFALPLRPVAALESLLGLEDMSRVRVRATVIQARAGEPLVVVESDTGLRILMQEPGAVTVQPGDRIEAAGLLGRDDGHLALRDAVVRSVGESPVPAPVALPRVLPIERGLDLRLVEAEAVVVSSLATAQQLRLTLQQDGEVFDALLPGAGPADFPPAPANGSRVRVRGLYDVRFARARQPIGFTLQLRSGADLAVLAPPAWLTAGRAAAIVGIFAVFALLGAGGTVILRRRVAQQTEQIRRQLERQAHLEAELERDRRLKSIGSLAGGIAHDFNNLLTGILGNLSLMMSDAALHSRFGPNLQDALSAAKRARGLTAQLSTLASGGAPVRQHLDLVPWLRDVIERTVPGNWTLTWTSHIGHLELDVDTEQLGQAVRTLVRYAVVEGAREGRLDALLRLDRSGAATDAGRDQVVLLLRDNGPRPDPATLAEIFDPYSESYFGEDRFALALAYSIAKRHGGDLSASVAPDGGGGTLFRLQLPLKSVPARVVSSVPTREDVAAGAVEDSSSCVSPPAGPKVESGRETSAVVSSPVPPVAQRPMDPPTPPMAPAEPDAGGAKTRVLVMDDEPPVARVIHRFLERLGYDVVVTADGEACIAAYGAALAAGRRFDVVIMDLTVPNGIGGAVAVIELRRLDPTVRAVATSGYSSDSIMADPEAHGFVGSVRKPFELKDMRDALRRAVEPA